MTDFTFIIESFLALVKGIPITIELTVISVVVGFWLAVALALMRRSRFAPFRWFVAAYVFAFRGTPLLVQIFLVYYGPGQFAFVRNSVLWVVLREPYWCALISLSLITAAYGSEIIRGACIAYPPAQSRRVRRSACLNSKNTGSSYFLWPCAMPCQLMAMKS